MLNFLFTISSSRGLTFTIELLLLTSFLVILFGSGSEPDFFQVPPHHQGVSLAVIAERHPNRQTDNKISKTI
jgi:hypothetical protein